MFVFAFASWTGAASAGAYVQRALEVRGHSPREGEVVHRRVLLQTPPGWTAELEPSPRLQRFFGPQGEGRILAAALTHPEQLSVVLDELRRTHPGSVPGPPEPLELPRLVPVMGDRATRYAITGRQLGEMVMVERRGIIVLVAVVVEPASWERVSGLMSQVYRSIDILDGQTGRGGRPWRPERGATRDGPHDRGK